MPYSIGVYFDHKTDILVRNIWEELAKNDLASYLHDSGNIPHLTLEIFEDLDVGLAKKALEKFSQSQSPLPISFQQIGLFPSPGKVFFWGPVVTDALLLLHKEINEVFRFCDSPRLSYYEPGNWIPHCALTMDINDQKSISRIVDICSTLPNPHAALITKIGLISFRPVKQICIYDLKISTPYQKNLLG